MSYLTGRQLCPACGKYYDYGEFHGIVNKKVVSKPTCRRCESRSGGILADRKSIAKASRALVDALSKAKASETADLPAIIDTFKKKVGGVDAIAEMLATDIRRLHGDGLQPEELEDFRFNEQVIQKYHQLVLRIISDKDDKVSQYDLSSLSEDDLRAILAPLAIELVRTDATFRDEILRMANLTHTEVIGSEVLAEEGEDVDGIEQSPDGEAVRCD